MNQQQRVGEWYREHGDAAWRFARQLCGQDAEAADAEHAAFMMTLQRNLQPRSPEHTRSWLLGIVRNQVRMSQRSQARRRKRERAVLAQAPQAPISAPPQTLEATEARALVRQSLAELGERDRAVLHLFYLEGLPQAEIAETLGATPTAVGVWMLRARRRLEKNSRVMVVQRC